jgi:hypothetical protein
MDTSRKKPTQKTRKLVRKLIALLSSPNKGEADAARVKLERLQKRYLLDDVTLEQISEQKQNYIISFKNAWEKKLLTDVICWVMNDIHPKVSGIGKDQMLLFVSPTQYRTILGAFNHCRDQFNDIAEVISTIIITKAGMMVNQNDPSNVDDDPPPTDVIHNGEEPTPDSGSNEPAKEEEPPPAPPPTDDAFSKQIKAQNLMYRLFGAIDVEKWSKAEPLPLGLPDESDSK